MDLIYPIVILVILIFLLSYKNNNYTGGGILDTNWAQQSIHLYAKNPYHPAPTDQNPNHQIYKLISTFGPPDVINTDSRGFAVWRYSTLKNRGSCFDRIFINDQSDNFITIWMHYPYPIICDLSRRIQLTNDLLTLDYHIDYDEKRNNLVISGNRLSDITVYLVVAIRLINGQLTLLEAKQMIAVLLDKVNPQSFYFDPLTEYRHHEEICTSQKKIYNQLISDD